MSRTHAHTTTHTLTSSCTFRFVLRLCPSKICACLCQSGVEHVCKFSDVEPSSAMKVNAWTCRFFGRTPGCVLQDVVSTENQVDFTEGHKIFVTGGQRAILKRYIASRQNSGKKGSIDRCDPTFWSSWGCSSYAPKFWRRIWGRNREARTMRPQSCVDNG